MPNYEQICTYSEKLCSAAQVCRRNIMHYITLHDHTYFIEPDKVFPHCRLIMPFSKNALPSSASYENPDDYAYNGGGDDDAPDLVLA